MSGYLKDPRYIYAYPVFMCGLCKMNKGKAFFPVRGCFSWIFCCLHWLLPTLRQAGNLTNHVTCRLVGCRLLLNEERQRWGRMRVWTFTDLLFVGTDKNALVHTCPTLSLPLPLKPQFLRSHIVRASRHQIWRLFSVNYLFRENKLVQTKPGS